MRSLVPYFMLFLMASNPVWSNGPITLEGKIEDIHKHENRIVINDQSYELVQTVSVSRSRQTISFDRLVTGQYVRFTLIKQNSQRGVKISSIEVIPKPEKRNID